MYEVLEDVLLRQRVLHLAALDDGLLVQHLHRVDLPVVLLAHLEHLAEAALADDLKEIKVLQADGLGGRHSTADRNGLWRRIDTVALLRQRVYPVLAILLRTAAHVPDALGGLEGEAELLLLVLYGLDLAGPLERDDAEATALGLLGVHEVAAAEDEEALLPRLPAAALLRQEALPIELSRRHPRRDAPWPRMARREQQPHKTASEARPERRGLSRIFGPRFPPIAQWTGRRQCAGPTRARRPRRCS